jgi:transposase InsO family protein
VLLDLVHSYVVGHVKVPLISNCLFYISFIDAYSRMTWVYFLISKYEVFCLFKEFKDLLENQTSRKIKVLRIDNGSEFCFVVFDRFYKENDISRCKTTPYTPQHNGVVECMNMILMERDRRMLHRVSLEQKLWI